MQKQGRQHGRSKMGTIWDPPDSGVRMRGGWRTKQHGDIATVMGQRGGRQSTRKSHWHIPTHGGSKEGRQWATRHHDARGDPGPGVYKPTRRNHDLRRGDRGDHTQSWVQRSRSCQSLEEKARSLQQPQEKEQR